MKYVLKICCLMLIFVGCNETPENIQLPKVESKSSEKDEETKKAHFPIDVIIKNSKKRKSKYDLKEKACGDCNQIPSSFFQKYLDNYSVKNIKDFKLKFDEYARYYFFDYVKFNDYVLFTIIHDDEDGYDNYYHFTYDKTNDKINDVVLVASVGGDGGQYQNETLLYANSFSDLRVKTKSVYDEDLFDDVNKNCYSRTTDNYDTKFNFKRDKTKIIQENSKTTCDTICD